MNTHLISVIVPIYNVENYLRCCIESIVKQTYQNIEIILVDDGSTDSCPQICEEYVSKDSRISVIHQENGGLSEARNTGIKFARGEYITFVDSDDVLELDMLEYLYNKMIEQNADIVQCQNMRIDEFGDIVGHYCDVPDVLAEDNHTCMKIMLSDMRFNTTAWAKLYRLSLLGDVRFPKGKYNEDVFTTYKLIAKCKRMYIGGERKYLYRVRSGSIMLESFKPKHMDGIDGKEEQCKYIEDSYPALAKYAHADIVYASNIRSLHMGRSGKIYPEYINRMQKLYRLYEFDYLRYSQSKLSAKLFSILAYVNLNVTIHLIKSLSNARK